MMSTYFRVLVLGIWLAAAPTRSEDGFYYFNSWFRRGSSGEDCKVCYGDNDCISLSQARCELYTATTAALADEEGPQDLSKPDVRRHVDVLMYTLIERASTSSAITECIPLISEYTDCTKENVCLGCVSCSCDVHGRWSCRSGRRCRPEQPLKVDHHALVFAIENLKSDGSPSFRLKRSVPTEITPSQPHRVSFEELAEWLYDVGPVAQNYVNFSYVATENTSTTNVDNGEFYMASKATNPTDDTESDYIVFNDVLRSINFETKNHSHNNNTFEHDYINLGDTDVMYNEIGLTEHLHNKNEGYTDTIATTTEGMSLFKRIDLLERARNRVKWFSTKNKTDFPSFSEKIDALNKSKENYTAYESSNEIDQWNIVNIVKRDVSQFLPTKVELTTVTEKTTSDSTINGLDGSIYQPLNKIINDKQQELEDLLKIKSNLIEILKLNKSKEFLVVFNKSETLDKTNKSHFSFYNLEIHPKLDHAYKRSNVKDLDKYLKILKRDIYVVMKDVSIIQKFTGRHNIPEELKNLIRAMKHYIHKNGKIHLRNHQKQVNDDLRRWSGVDFVKQYLIAILQIIDKDFPQINALSPLSLKSKKIIKRIMKANKIDDFSALGIRVNDPSYNLTNDLKTIGLNWQEMTVKVSSSTPWNKVHNMKMLQYILESDINRMNDALALLDFAHSRRMVTLGDDVSNDELRRINTSLRSIQDKIKTIIRIKNKNRKQEGNKVVSFFTIKKGKKETFLKHIRNLLKSSKNDIVDLLHHKIPKAEIVKVLAKKKLDELTKNKLKKYENVMQKWQTNLDVNGRRKRSAIKLDHLRNQMKNILPKYLRGKVSPGIKRNSTKNKSEKGKRNRRTQIVRSKHNNRRNTSNGKTMNNATRLGSQTQ